MTPRRFSPTSPDCLIDRINSSGLRTQDSGPPGARVRFENDFACWTPSVCIFSTAGKRGPIVCAVGSDAIASAGAKYGFTVTRVGELSCTGLR